MICRKALFLAGLTLCVSLECIGQIVISAQNGYWHEPSTWTGGVVPSLTNCSGVRIDHDVHITGSVEASHLSIAGTLRTESGSILDILPDDSGSGTINVAQGGNFVINGTLIGRDAVEYETSISNTRFEEGSSFQYRGGSRGYIPFALWHANSNLFITGFAGSGYIAIAYSESWKQNFGNVFYDCPLQTSFVDLNGYLRNIQGDFRILNTNSQALRLSTTQRPVITVGGNFRVEGPSEVWITTTSDSARLIIGNNLEYFSNSTGPSYMTTRGRCFVEVGGKVHVDAAGAIRISSGSADSTGIRKTTFRIAGGIEVTRGSFIAPFPGTGVFVFEGDREQRVLVSATTFNGNFDFHVEPESIVDLGESEIRNSSGGIFVKGRVKLGSLHPGGALQFGLYGNVQIHGQRNYYLGAVLEYNGSADQVIGDAHPSHAGVSLIINTSGTVDLSRDIEVKDLAVQRGSLNMHNFESVIAGNVFVENNAGITGDPTFRLIGNEDQSMSLNGTVVRNIDINKGAGTSVTLLSPVFLTRLLDIRSSGTTLFANGHLTLHSTDDGPGGTAVVGSLPEGSSIEGDVTVQRFMSGEGRIYRYITSPVRDATVASLMDDFPITGLFLDPSSGRGINSLNPSFFYYDAEDPDQGWHPYPVSGYAHENDLIPGLGYAAFIREEIAPTVWDVTGILNQGLITLPVRYHSDAFEMYRGWNLMGNPYACAVGWGSATGWERSTTISEAIAVRDNGEKRFRYSDGEVGDLPGGLIAPGQAFWVHASGPDPVLKINENAKVNEDAHFFRQGKDEPDYIRLSLTGAGFHDEAFVRLRAGSSQNADRFDAVKRDNDKLNLSVLTNEGVQVAINAIPKLHCPQVFSMRMNVTALQAGKYERIPSGQYELLVEKFGLFDFAELSLLDHFLGDTIRQSKWQFTVSDDPGSFAADRFSLLVKSAPRTPYPGAITHKINCADTLVRILVMEGPAQASVVYSGLLDESEFPSIDNRYIDLPVSLFPKGEVRSVLILAANVCESITVDSLNIFREVDPIPPSAHSSTKCGTGTMVLFVDSKPGLRYRWYADAAKEKLIGTSDTLTTPWLNKTQTFFATAQNESGCESLPVKVEARVLTYDSLVITRDHANLYSNYAETFWFYDSKLLHVGPVFQPPRSGVFMSVAEPAGCVTTDTIAFAYSDHVEFYPVPFNDSFTIVSRSEGPVLSVKIFDLSGKVVHQEISAAHEVRVETAYLPAGTYLVQVQIDDVNNKFRIIKKD